MTIYSLDIFLLLFGMVLYTESALCIRRPESWTFSFSISFPMLAWSISSGLISFRTDWFDLLAVQGTLKNLLQDHNSKALFLRCSIFFMIQLLHPYMIPRKNIALTIQTFVGKVMSLIFNMLSSFVIAFFPKSNCLLISWLQSPSAVTLEPKKIICHCSHFFPFYFPWSDGTRYHNLGFF